MSTQPPLPSMQKRVFDKMAQEFDNREYNKALRSADTILKVVPEHADTIALKGLILNNMNRKGEGLELIKKALLFHPGSTIAWHSLGMYQRTERNYPEALKALKRALVTDPNNLNVLRDISSTCVQLREWEQFLEAREKLVTLKAGAFANWIALSCGHRMLGHNKLAAAVMDVMTAILDIGGESAVVGEVYLYRAELELECDEPRKALELLKRNDAVIKDTVAKLLLKAKAHALLGQKGESEKSYMKLISMGHNEADCIAAIAQLRKIPLDEYLRPKQEVQRYMELMEQVMVASPGKNNYAPRHLLDCVPLEQFRERLIVFTKPYITRMIPSLFKIFKSLYRDERRVQVIGKIFAQWEEELSEGNFSSFDGAKNPCYILWVYAFLATHYRRIGDFALAHVYIDKAIHHTPTLEQLYLEKAAIYAREGKTTEAAQQADFCRKLDLQDKYLNSKAAKYFFRDNQIEKGEETMQLFYKASVVPGVTYLTALESQCLWYELEVGKAFYRRGDYIAALQNLLMCELHHYHNHCELTEFHNYVFRRGTMRSWFDVIQCDSDIGLNKFFLKFCPSIVRSYMKVDELGEEAVRAAHTQRPELALEGVSAEEVKHLTQLRKDYYLTKFDLTQPMEKAGHYLKYLLTRCAHQVDTHILAVEYYTKLRKPLLVARGLLALKKLKYANTQALIDTFTRELFATRSSSMDGRVKDVVEEIFRLIKKLDE